MLSPKSINELRFQFRRSVLSNTGDNSIPSLSVQGAFEGGGAQIGNSGNISKSWELANSTTLTHSTHTMKWGARLRNSGTDNTSVNNFGGSYMFFGGLGPTLDANNQIVAGPLVQLTALERYQRTLQFQSLGYSAEQIRLLGGGASQFSLAAGTPLTSVSQFDAGVFFNDDWRIRQNLTLSYGVRYETQTNIRDYSNWAPRVALAWGIGGGAGKTVKTVLRVGAGVFYDRISDSVTLQSQRFNGLTQQSYLLINPNFFPRIPSADLLQTAQQPRQLQLADSTLRAPRNYQASVGVERQIGKYTKLSVQYVGGRGVHLQRVRNINAPIDGVYPYSDKQLRLLTETTGFSRSHQIIFSPNVNYRKMFLFGFYSIGQGKTDAEGSPADPYNLRAEWGPSSFSDVRHRAVIGTSLPMPWKITLSPFLMMNSGSPYNITTGRDMNGDGFTNERPSLVSGLNSDTCTGGDFAYAPGMGCFNLNPAVGTAITRNYARGPATFTLNLRLGRSWAFGSRGESGLQDGGMPPGGPGGGGPPAGGGGPGGGPPPGGGMGGGGMRGGGPGGMFGGSSSGKKYNLTLSLSANNVLNHANFAAPSGDLSSPYFGEYRSLAGGFGPMGGGSSTYNRKIDVQLRFTF